ncbi:MAG: hypothetical protein Q9190_007425, partial [Brigantiaea leucoxantha]
MELAKAQSEAEAGDFWLVAPKGKEQWPVVICDEDMVMRFFKKNLKRPLNARQVDGSWPKDNGSGAFQAYDRCFPAMYLGTLKLCWVPARLLRPTDTDTVRQLRCNTSNLELTQAFTDLIEHFHHKELSYWKDVLLARQLSEENDKTFISDARATPVPSRENSPYTTDKERMKRPIGRSVLDFERRHKSESDDEEPELSLFNFPNPAAKKVKLEGTETASRMYEITPFKRLPNIVSIYAGNPHKVFPINRSNIERSPFLAQLQAWNDTNGWYIMAPALSSVHSDDFLPVADYLNHGEYHPRLLLDNADVDTNHPHPHPHPHLEGITSTSTSESNAEILKCAIVFVLAQQMELPQLQQLA